MSVRPISLILILLLYMLGIGGCMALLTRWTNTPAWEQPYARPLRTRPPSPLP